VRRGLLALRQVVTPPGPISPLQCLVPLSRGGGGAIQYSLELRLALNVVGNLAFNQLTLLPQLLILARLHDYGGLTQLMGILHEAVLAFV
jgi:hypothetical protein